MVVERADAKRSYINVDADFAYDTDLSLEARFLWVILKHHAQNDTGECWPGFARLSIILGKTEKTVRVALTELVAGGFVTCKRRGQGKTNLYTINDLRTVNSPVQEPQNGNVVPFRTAYPPVLEQSKTTDKVITSEILPKVVVAPTTTRVSQTVLQEVCQRLGIKKDIDAEELVERSMGTLPDTDHIARALKCKGHYPDWSKKSEMKRAGHFASFCETEKNPRERPGYTIQAASSNGGSSPSEYVRYDTPIKATIPQFRAVFQSIRSWGTCTMKKWTELENLGEHLKADGTLLFLADDEASRQKVERNYKYDLNSACREHQLTYAIGVAS